jgi:hypothetical protein
MRNASGGATNIITPTNRVMSLMARWRCVAMMSLPPLAQRST